MSFSIVAGGCFFDTGIIVAVFHSFGSTPSLRELLNIAVTGAARRCEYSFNADRGILSGPVALFTLMLSSANLVSLSLMVNLAGSGSLMSKMVCVAHSFGKSSPIDTKHAFIWLTKVSISPPVNAFAKPIITTR